MKEKIQSIIEEVKKFESSDPSAIEEFRVKILGRKGILQELFNEFKTCAPDEKKTIGPSLNELKNLAENKVKAGQEIQHQTKVSDKSGIDLTLPGEPHLPGSRHPLSLVKDTIIKIFSGIGYTVSEGPEMEDDWHNFSALNFPEDHPARDMQDTFFVSSRDGLLLRTHTSTVQVRVMENTRPPIRTISPGRVYRNEAISARANCFFHQVEGLYIDEGVNMGDLKQNLLYFAREMFDEETRIRLRPSYFPFTEPSAEMDISCNICGGTGCTICKYSGWVEILGCGMVDPRVLENCKIDAKKYQGFAFGMGIERIAMLKYKVNDLRTFFDNDVRFLREFSGLG